MPDIHVSSCVLSILQVIVIFKPVDRRGACAGWRYAHPAYEAGDTLVYYTSSSRRVGSSSSSLIATRKPTDSRPSIRR
ncbi:hypothetical protein C2U53_17135 [Citrobacter sp. CFNIH10]|nr:hypothetical protein C2U53_17135 [Citrobacter sp. CFNIH10]PNP35379.1 hypothetical protein AL525_016730 [Citrobacter amalonaticus]RSC58922.1 hypothetical protein EGW07_15335 [Citrobacter amalonaticus]HAU5793839.1 hypothetical protein [Citrobacter amalonaticus]